MNTTKRISTSLTALLSALLSLGLVFHDSQAEHAFAVAVSRPLLSAYHESETTKPLDEIKPLHVHSDYNPLLSTLANSFNYQQPSLMPRRNSHHKELLRMFEVGSRHAFDNANLPIID